MQKYIWIKNKKYWYHSTYENPYTAYKMAKYLNKKTKGRYFIKKENEYYKLYTTRAYTLW